MRWEIALLLGLTLSPATSIAQEAATTAATEDSMSAQTPAGEVSAPSARSLRDLTKIIRSPDRLDELEGALAELDGMAQSGDAQAALLLGNEYTKDRGTLPVDYDKAVSYLERAAQLGLTDAYMTLADWHRREAGGLASDKALSYLQSAADAGLTKAQVPLAYAYQRGTYGTPDPEMAKKYFALAAEAGDASAAKQLASIYRAGTGSPDDAQNMIKYMGVSADAGDTGAMRSLADLYLKGELVPKDTALAEQYLRKAADAGDASATLMLARALLRDDIGGDRASEGVDLLQGAFDAGSVNVASALADAYLRARGTTADIPKALEILKTASVAGDHSAQAALLNLYVRGAGGDLKPDLSAARDLYQQIPDSMRSGSIAANGALLAASGPGQGEFSSMWSLFDKLDPAARARTGAAIWRTNKNAYVYLLQNLLTKQGLYSGDINGQLTPATIIALDAYCGELDVAQECRFGPLTRTTWDAISAKGLTN